MPTSHSHNNILEHSEYYLDKIETDLKAGPALKMNQSERPSDNVNRTYNRLYILSVIIIDEDLKNDLQNLILKTYEISENGFGINDQIEWLNKLASTVASSEKILTAQLCGKIRTHVKKEVAFIELNCKNEDMVDTIKLIQREIFNTDHLDAPPTLQQTYVNVLVNEAINFRLSTLSIDQAWDFTAQSIFEYSKIKPV